eukprot:gi/632948646/ref/XP_007889709.1/ PREDICTED: interleukin-12 subunit beta [Callorhinchus milii]
MDEEGGKAVCLSEEVGAERMSDGAVRVATLGQSTPGETMGLTEDSQCGAERISLMDITGERQQVKKRLRLPARNIEQDHVVKKGSSKIIKCNTYTDEPQEGIEWRLNNIPKAHGNKHKVVMIDRPDAGNYTCYLNGKLLAYHYVLIDEPEEAKEQVKKDISCEANKFNGTFTCTWFREIKSSQFSASFYRKGSSGEMVSCKITDDAKCMNAICNDTTYSPYAEEFQPVIFILEAATKTRYESYSKTFSIRDICKY